MIGTCTWWRNFNKVGTFSWLAIGIVIGPWLSGTARAADGALDPTFGINGKAVATLTGVDIFRDAALQADGKIVIVAVQNMARLSSAGEPDPTFGSGGVVAFAPTQATFGAVALQSDGKIVVAGGKNGDVAVARYRSNGTLDPSFGTNGVTTVDLGATQEESVAVAIRNDGRIAVAAKAFHSGSTQTDFAVVRIMPTGARDTSFNGDGVAILSLTPLHDTPTALTFQADGKLVIAGGAFPDYALVRYDDDGALDPSFGGQGIVVGSLTGQSVVERAESLAIQPDGAIVIAVSGTNVFSVVRHRPDGTLDTSFATNGVSAGINGRSDAVALQRDGKILVAGKALGGFGLARLNADGTSDLTFGTQGVAKASFAPRSVSPVEPLRLRVRLDGRILITATLDSQQPTGLDGALARFEGPPLPDLRFFLRDVGGELGSITAAAAGPMISMPLTQMTLHEPLADVRSWILGAQHTAAWVSDVRLSGTSFSPTSFRLSLPCTEPLSPAPVTKLITVSARSADLTTVRPLAAVSAADICGALTDIPMIATDTRALILQDELLQLSISSQSSTLLEIHLGADAFLGVIGFVPTP